MFMFYKCMYFALRFVQRKFPVRNSGSQSLTVRLTLLIIVRIVFSLALCLLHNEDSSERITRKHAVVQHQILPRPQLRSPSHFLHQSQPRYPPFLVSPQSIL